MNQIKSSKFFCVSRNTCTQKLHSTVLTIPDCVSLHVFDSLRVYHSGPCCRHGCGLFSFIPARPRLSSLAVRKQPRHGQGPANTRHLLANQVRSSRAAWTENEMFRGWADTNSRPFRLRLVPSGRAAEVRRRIQGALGAAPRRVGGGGGLNFGDPPALAAAGRARAGARRVARKAPRTGLASCSGRPYKTRPARSWLTRSDPPSSDITRAHTFPPVTVFVHPLPCRPPVRRLVPAPLRIPSHLFRYAC